MEIVMDSDKQLNELSASDLWVIVRSLLVLLEHKTASHPDIGCSPRAKTHTTREFREEALPEAASKPGDFSSAVYNELKRLSGIVLVDGGFIINWMSCDATMDERRLIDMITVSAALMSSAENDDNPMFIRVIAIYHHLRRRSRSFTDNKIVAVSVPSSSDPWWNQLADLFDLAKPIG